MQERIIHLSICWGASTSGAPLERIEGVEDTAPRAVAVAGYRETTGIIKCKIDKYIDNGKSRNSNRKRYSCRDNKSKSSTN